MPRACRCAKRSLSSGNAPDQIAAPLPDSLPEVPGTVLQMPETENWLYLCTSARRYSRARTSGSDARQHKGFVMKDRTGIWCRCALLLSCLVSLDGIAEGTFSS